MTKRILIAEIAGAHGIKGFAKLNFFGEDLSFFDSPVYVGENGEKTLHISIKGKMKNQYLVEIQDITDRTSCEKLKGQKLFINHNSLPETEDDEVYYDDLIGLACLSQNGEALGKVISVQNYGAGDLLEIKPDGKTSFYTAYKDTDISKIKDGILMIDMPEYI